MSSKKYGRYGRIRYFRVFFFSPAHTEHFLFAKNVDFLYNSKKYEKLQTSKILNIWHFQNRKSYSYSSPNFILPRKSPSSLFALTI